MTRSVRLAQGLSAIIIAYSIWIVSRGYIGIIHDARIYMGQALAVLDPSGIGLDPLFSLDVQSKYTFYGKLVVPLVRALGVDFAAQGLTFFGISIWFLGATRILTSVTTWRLCILGLIWASVAPSSYGANSIFNFGENFAAPRAIAEGLVLLALGFATKRNYIFAIPCLILAGLAQPIMALPGITIFMILVPMLYYKNAQLRVILFLILTLFMGIVISFICTYFSVLPSLFGVMDADWLHVLQARDPFMFFSKWPIAAWTDLFLLAAIVGLQIYLFEGNLRAILIAVAISAIIGMIVSGILGDILGVRLIIQAQLWRGLWVLRAVSALMFPCLIDRVWNLAKSKVDLRFVTLAFLAASFFTPVFSPVSTMLGLAIWVTQSTSFTSFVRSQKLIKISILGLSIFVIINLLASTFVIYRIYINNTQYSFEFNILYYYIKSQIYKFAATLFILHAESNDGIKSYIQRLLDRNLLKPYVAIACFCLGLLFWDQRSTFQKLTDSGKYYHDEIQHDLGPIRRGVWWMGESVSPWFFVGAPTWQNSLQGTAGVFSRPLAMKWYKRTSSLMQSGLATQLDLNPWLDANENSPTNWPFPTRTRMVSGIKSICSNDDFPDVIVVPFNLEKDFPATAVNILQIKPPRLLVRGKSSVSIISSYDHYTFVHCEPLRSK